MTHMGKTVASCSCFYLLRLQHGHLDYELKVLSKIFEIVQFHLEGRPVKGILDHLSKIQAICLKDRRANTFLRMVCDGPYESFYLRVES